MRGEDFCPDHESSFRDYGSHELNIVGVVSVPFIVEDASRLDVRAQGDRDAAVYDRVCFGPMSRMLSGLRNVATVALAKRRAQTQAKLVKGRYSA